MCNITMQYFSVLEVNTKSSLFSQAVDAIKETPAIDTLLDSTVYLSVSSKSSVLGMMLQYRYRYGAS